MTCCVCQVRGGSEVCAVCDGESRLRLSRDVRAEERAKVEREVVTDLRRIADSADRTWDELRSMHASASSMLDLTVQARTYRNAADRIERGEHRPKPGQGGGK